MKDKVKRYRFLFEELVKRDFKKKYKRTYLGMLWSVTGPLATLGVMALVFTQFFGRNVDHYIIYLFCGNVIFNFFKESTSTGMTSLNDNAPIFTKINVPKYMFLLSKNVSALINFGINLVIMMIFILIEKVNITWLYLMLFYPILCLIMFNLGCGLILSALYLMFRDIKYLYDIFVMLLMYASAIFYNINEYDNCLRNLFYLNPVYVYIEYFRTIVLQGRMPSLFIHIIAFVYAALALVIGAIIYKRKNYMFIYYV